MSGEPATTNAISPRSRRLSPLTQLAQRVSAHFLMDFGQLAQYDGSSVAKNLDQLLQGPPYAARIRTSRGAHRPSRHGQPIASRSPRSRGRNPSVRNGPSINPDALTAAARAEGPGIGDTRYPASSAAVTRSAPGSETAGVPASVISATSPDASASRRSSRR